MSRLVFFKQNGESEGDIQANCDRGWAINDGGSVVVPVSSENVTEYMQFGRLVMVEHPRLPAWAGVMDTPWSGILPVQMTLYDAPYLLHYRSVSQAITLKGTAGSIVLQMLALANAQEDTRIRAGLVEMGGAAREHTIDTRNIWEQMKAFATTTGMEIALRPDRDATNRIIVYLDFKARLGADTGYLLHDGQNANMEVTGVKVSGEIWNQVTGVGSGSTLASRLISAAHRDENSITGYRLRSKVVQFQSVTAISTLEKNTETSLQGSKAPILTLTVNALDIGNTFLNARLGNSLVVHGCNVVLPGNVRGWRGLMRITKMGYSESTNKLSMELVGAL